MSAQEGQSGPAADIVGGPSLTHSGQSTANCAVAHNGPHDVVA
jgi:hypothetical protein